MDLPAGATGSSSDFLGRPRTTWVETALPDKTPAVLRALTVLIDRNGHTSAVRSRSSRQFQYRRE